MSNPMALSKNEAAKWVFIAITGLVASWAGSIMQTLPPLSFISVSQNILAVFFITYAGGMIIYGIRRLFGKPKTQRSTLRHALYYGFFLTMLLFVLQVILLVELLIMRG